jgi:glycosyltransferase involved in cell wall biosynthesis
LVAPYQVRVLEASGAVDTARWMSPLKIFEYMAARKAIVASDLPAIREILRNGETALLVQADHLDSWVAAVRKLMDPRYRSRLSANAYQTFEANFTWRQRAQRVVDGI